MNIKLNAIFALVDIPTKLALSFQSKLTPLKKFS